MIARLKRLWWRLAGKPQRPTDAQWTPQEIERMKEQAAPPLVFNRIQQRNEWERAQIMVASAEKLLAPDQKVIPVLPDSRVLETAGKSRPN